MSSSAIGSELTLVSPTIAMASSKFMIGAAPRNEDMSVFRSQGCTFLALKYVTVSNFPFKPYEWRGLRQTRGLRSKARRVLSQFSPHDFTAFKWGTASSFTHYFTVVLLLAVFLAAELNPFYLKV